MFKRIKSGVPLGGASFKWVFLLMGMKTGGLVLIPFVFVDVVVIVIVLKIKSGWGLALLPVGPGWVTITSSHSPRILHITQQMPMPESSKVT